MKHFYIISLMFFSIALHSQEICNNGIDDDGDGLIDLNDEECLCLDNLVSNGTFDGPCNPFPDTWDSSLNTNYATGSVCDGNGINCCMPDPPAPATDFIQLTTSGLVATTPLYQCLIIPLDSGETYTLTYDYGITSGPLQEQNPPPFTELYLYGIVNCPEDYDENQLFCPGDDYDGPLELLDLNIIDVQWNVWQNHNVEITPDSDIEGIVMVPSCWGTIPNLNLIYTNFTNLVIEGDPPQELIDPVLEVGSVCGEWIANADLSLVNIPDPTIQWYLDSVAIDGATDLTYIVPPGTVGFLSYAITNPGECGISIAVEIPADPIVEIDGNVNDNPCLGEANGSVELEILTGIPPYQYEWSNGQDDIDLTDVPGGTYTVTVTDDIGCTGTASFTVNEPSAVLTGEIVEALEVDPSTGFGLATVSASGGTEPYTYQWSNGESGATATMLEPGLNSVTITDANGCTFIVEVEIELIPLAVEELLISSCQNICTGSIEINVSGGIMPYDIVWDEVLNGFNPAGVCPDTYFYTITDDYGSQISGEIEMLQFEAPDIDATIVDVNCGDLGSGSISISATGDGPFGYLWSNGANTSSINNLDPGIYELTISDSNGCLVDTSFNVGSSGYFEVEEEFVGLTCFNGNDASIELTVVDRPLDEFTFVWSSGENSNVISNLSAGSYSVTIEDLIFDCDIIQTYEIQNPDPLEFSIIGDLEYCLGDEAVIEIQSSDDSIEIVWEDGVEELIRSFSEEGTYGFTLFYSDVCEIDSVVQLNFYDSPLLSIELDEIDCGEDTLGAIYVEATDDLGPISYLWSDGSMADSLINIGVGLYSLSVTNALGCETDTSIVLENSSFSFEIEGESFICQDDVTSLTLSGEDFENLNILWNTGDTTQIISDISSGEYAVTVTDADGCSAASIFLIENYPLLEYEIDKIDEQCLDFNDGSINITGDAIAQIVWADGSFELIRQNLAPGNYSFELTDTFGCRYFDEIEIFEGFDFELDFDVINAVCVGDNSSVFIDLDNPGDYEVNWFDGSNLLFREFPLDGVYALEIVHIESSCRFDTIFEIDRYEFEEFQIDVQNAACGLSNGEISISNPDQDLDYAWSTGANNFEIIDLEEGDYEVTVSNALGCDTIFTFEIMNTPPLDYEIQIDDVLCRGDENGAIQIISSGNIQEIYLNNELVAGTNLNNLEAGNYELQLIDIFGCSYFESVSISQPDDQLQLDLISIVQDIAGTGEGSILVDASGGTAPYSFLWNTGQNTAQIDGLFAGSYSVTVIDANGCEDEASFEIENNQLFAEVVPLDVLCFEECTGELIVDINGGILPYEIQVFDSFQQSTELFDLCAGVYSVIVSDASGQIINVEDVIIEQPEEEFQVSILPDIDTIELESNEFIQLELNSNSFDQIETVNWYVNGDVFCSGDASDCGELDLTFTEDIILVLEAFDLNGCVSYDTLYLMKRQEIDIDFSIPNVLALSSNNNNDIWRVNTPEEIEILSIQIYDRWGNRVFSSSGSQVEWNGYFLNQPVTSGVYVYRLTYLNTLDNSTRNRFGDVTVID